jgi:Uncharacterized protein conserved in archaea (DUF2115)
MLEADTTIFLQRKEFESAADEIREIVQRIGAARTKGQLGEILAIEVQRYSLFDLQIIGGRLNREISKLPVPYRENVRPYFMEQLLGKHHRLLLMYRTGEFSRKTGPLSDIAAFQGFCSMVPDGCFAWDECGERNPFFLHPKNRLFYYLIAAFTMFVLEEPGHPAGMPFPGGFTVEQRGNDFYCLIRDKEKEVFYSICNFCPAKQREEP